MRDWVIAVRSSMQFGRRLGQSYWYVLVSWDLELGTEVTGLDQIWSVHSVIIGDRRFCFRFVCKRGWLKGNWARKSGPNFGLFDPPPPVKIRGGVGEIPESTFHVNFKIQALVYLGAVPDVSYPNFFVTRRFVTFVPSVS